MLKTFELMQQKLIAETEQKIRKAKDEAESHFLGKMAAQTEGFLTRDRGQVSVPRMERRSAGGRWRGTSFDY